MPKEHSKQRIDAYVRLLSRHKASKTVVEDFLEIVEIDNAIAAEPEGTLEFLDRLLFDVCRRFNFSQPFGRPEQRAWFRPYLIDSNLPEHAPDAPGEFDPVIEQAYRRGFDQGFADARALVNDRQNNQLARRAAQIRAWRLSKIFFGASRPGDQEPFGIKLSVQTSLPPKIRWQVLSCDQHRCRGCGTSAADGATLHVDHVVSRYHGGSDDLSNLQTLCQVCNLGKGKD